MLSLMQYPHPVSIFIVIEIYSEFIKSRMAWEFAVSIFIVIEIYSEL